MNFYILDQSNIDEAEQQLHWDKDFDVSADVTGQFSGDVTLKQSTDRLVRSNFSDTSVVLVLDVNGGTGTRRAKNWQLNNNGQQQLAMGQHQFLKHCGVLFDNKDHLSVHFYIIITIYTSSSSVKSEIHRKFGFDGKFKAIGAGGVGTAFGDKVDDIVSHTSGVLKFDLKVSTWSDHDLSGLGELLTAVANVQEKPAEGAIHAAGAFLTAHGSDQGVTQYADLVPVSSVVASINYPNIEDRLDYAKRMLALRRSFDALYMMAKPDEAMAAGPDPANVAAFQILGTARLICGLNLSHNKSIVYSAVCGTNIPSFGTGSSEWASPLVLKEAIKIVDQMVDDCLLADDASQESKCKVEYDQYLARMIKQKVLFPNGLSRWIGNNAVADLKSAFPDRDVEATLANPSSLTESDPLLKAALDKFKSRYPEFYSYDGLTGIYDKLGSNSYEFGSIFSSAKPIGFRAVEAYWTAPGCLNFHPEDNHSIESLSNLDVSNLRYSIDLDFNTSIVIQSVVVEYFDGSGRTWNFTVSPDTSPGLAGKTLNWIVATCDTRRFLGSSRLDDSYFDIRAKLSDPAKANAAGTISVAYYDLYGLQQRLIQSFRVEAGKIYLNNLSLNEN